tara:strand:- start:18854 stop:20074 length:1221 start_codon:yes stop_codon:yes gene_type:complete
MSKQLINIGSVANDNTGDTLRAGGDKVNDNFNELYNALGNGADLQINVSGAGTNQVLRYNGSNFIPSDYNIITSNLDTGDFDIISTSDRNIDINPGGAGKLRILTGSITHSFDNATGVADFPTRVTYKNEYAAIGDAPTPATYAGYFYTIDGDDNPYVNMNITSGGVGDTRTKILTEYSTIDLLNDVDTTSTAPTLNQVLKWNGTNWVPADDLAGVSAINTYASFAGDTGTTTADSQTDLLTVSGGTDITTSVIGDTLTISYSGTPVTSFAALTDTNTAGLVQGDMLYWNGSSWIPTRSPIIWWELNANGNADYTVTGPGFTGTVNDPAFYVYRGFTYAFDNSVQGGGHPFRIQSTQGLTGTPYTEGQSGSGSSVLYWTVPMDAPNSLYYQCTLHSLMNGTITVVG